MRAPRLSLLRALLIPVSGALLLALLLTLAAGTLGASLPRDPFDQLAYAQRGPNGILVLAVRDVARGLSLRVLPQCNAVNEGPAWSVDGGQMAFVARCALADASDWDPRLFISGAYGGGLRSVDLTRYDLETLSIRTLRWMPDSSGVVFTAVNRRTQISGIYQWTLADDSVGLLADSVRFFEGYAIAPDGCCLAFSDMPPELGRRQFTHLDLASGTRTQIGVPRGVAFPDWSPDGGQIAFMSPRMGSVDYSIYVMTPDGGGIQQVTPPRLNALHPRWSADGRALSFYTVQGFSAVALYAAAPDGSDLRRLAAHEAFHAWRP